VRRREFISLLGSAAAALPRAARAQQSAIPVIGFLSALSQPQTAHMIAALRRGLSEAGLSDGQGVTIDYLFAEGQYERLPGFAGKFVSRPVSLIVAAAPPAALAAKTATTTIPIVFVVGFDPVTAGLVASFNRPGGNATGIFLITATLGQKRVELLRDLNPSVSVIAMLVNPISPDAAPEIKDVEAAAQANNISLKLLSASTPPEIDAAFASIADEKPAAFLCGSDPFFVTRREQIIAHVARLKLPAIYPFREFPASGGLISYGTSLAGAYRQAGVYAGRILKGAKPADLPVLQPTTFELVLNLKTAKALGIDVPATLHARTDEVIE
jgi:putative tryptophan/tyrosine transport system substrate-binding protein